MKCPKCDSSEVNDAGTCPACGFHFEPQHDNASEHHSDENRTPPDGQDEMPEWRIQLSRRLQEIKEKRVGHETKSDSDGTPPLPFPQAETTSQKKQETEGPAPPVMSKTARRAAVAGNVRRSAERAAASRQVENVPAPPSVAQTQVPDGVEAATAVDVALQPKATRASSSGEVRHLIDEVVTMHAAKTEQVPVPVIAAPQEEPDNETKLILLSRTLSGMIDLLAVFICTVGFVVAEDVFSGLEMFDRTSFMNAALVFLATYFLYSMFFLGAACQTIGMMITHLRLVGTDGKRPALSRILGRCAIYIPSVLLLGAGLLWGCFDREAKCLHDHLSGTRIEPLAL